MQYLRLADLSMIYYIKDLCYNNGYADGKFSIVDAFPTDLSNLTVLPTVSVESTFLSTRGYQLGSTDKGILSFTIDVFAKSDGQADDIAYLIWNDFKNNNIPIYDFNSAFPSTYNDYSGISQIGNLSLDKPTLRTIPSPIMTVEEEQKYHRLLTIQTQIDLL